MEIKDPSFWKLNSLMILRMLHKYKTRSMAQFLDIYDRDILDDEGEPILHADLKSDPLFFEKIVAILPMYVK